MWEDGKRKREEETHAASSRFSTKDGGTHHSEATQGSLSRPGVDEGRGAAHPGGAGAPGKAGGPRGTGLPTPPAPCAWPGSAPGLLCAGNAILCLAQDLQSYKVSAALPPYRSSSDSGLEAQDSEKLKANRNLKSYP
jgi:hypothetical protein